MYSKYPNQVMKIICPSVLMLDALMYGFYLSYLKEIVLVLYSNVLFLKEIVMSDKK